MAHYRQTLRSSISLPNPLNLTLHICSLFLKSCFSHSPSLINHLSQSSHLPAARRRFLDMPESNTISYNTLINDYAVAGLTGPAFRLFDDLRRCNLNPDVFTLTSLLKSCGSNSRANAIAHAIAVRIGLNSGAFLISVLIRNYSKYGDLNSAEKCFDELLILDSVVWTTMISGFVQNAQHERAKEVFVQMRALGLCLNEFTLTIIVGAFVDFLDIEWGRCVHGLGIKMGFLSGLWTATSNAVLSMYLRCGCRLDGIKVFDEIREPDVVSWSALVGAYSGEEAFGVFKFMRFSGVELNEYTVINVLSAIVGCVRLMELGKQIHAWCWRAGYLSVVSVCNALVSMYGRYRQIDEARRVFDEMLVWDCVSWNALIDGYAENGLVGDVLRMFSLMRRSSMEPTKFTLASVIEVISVSGALNQAMQIHSLIIKMGFESDDSMATGLITLYGRCYGIEESKRVFDETEREDAAHVNAMAAAFVHAGYHLDAMKLFRNAQNSDREINSVTFSVVLKACSALTALEQGRSIHALAVKFGSDQDNFAGSAAVDFYCKCGGIDDAEKVFQELPKDNLAAWNALITGRAQHGHYQAVLELFEKMTKVGIDPDEITFLGVLCSCCHVGRVEEAMNLLNSMVEDHGIQPHLEHYACIIDLLGRVGHLQEAKRSINRMPIKPDARIWQIFLSACNVHGNVELGKVAARELFELQPENESAYVLLSNLYASAGMWEEVGRMRKAMKDRTICKEPGCSWIQVKGTTYSFFANDNSHPHIGEINLKLEQLYKQTTTAEFIEYGV
ncbi:pentatricopeptide repeat-containing protein At3g09040, mitochondrial-like [Magnolia sinica]|uniref:pentatricopeptide repeat-containing protein At3g09040, mitochondrial-like n=1 Tax=Magnolia sinica TaxID=86752 RepID=UPI002659986B|nr:pentatricopeptide repeat-containing protein At3g09040, mitochondrial-like [Magnolia sinica]